MEKIAITRTIWIHAPRERVWQAVSDPNQIGKWWPPDEWEIPELKVGATIKFGKEESTFASITFVDPPRELILQWEASEKFPGTTTVIIRLEAENDGSRMNITESGFETLPDDMRDKWVSQTGEGYTLVLNTLKSMLEAEK